MKYIEERELRPIPGAFGYDKKREVKLFQRLADRDFLYGTGYYKQHLRILIEEEYGYRYWLWTYPGTVEEVIGDWKVGRRPVAGARGPLYSGCYSVRELFRGEIDEVHWTYGEDDLEGDRSALRLVETGAYIYCVRGRDDFDGQAHVHEEDDSSFKIGGYELYGLHEVREVIQVLEVMANL